MAVIKKRTISEFLLKLQFETILVSYTRICQQQFPSLIPGSLMVIAWIGFASVGIFMARYMKGAFDEKKNGLAQRSGSR